MADALTSWPAVYTAVLPNRRTQVDCRIESAPVGPPYPRYQLGRRTVAASMAACRSVTPLSWSGIVCDVAYSVFNCIDMPML